MNGRTSISITGVCLGVLSLGLASSPAPAASNDLLILPGRSVGRLHLGHDGAASLARMSNPDASDAGMSQTRQVWVSKGTPHYTLYIHTTSNGALDVRPLHGVTINEIRVTSPLFHTRSGLARGATLSVIKNRFNHLTRESMGEGSHRSFLYEDNRDGIAFEFRKDAPSARCISISVYMPDQGHAVTAWEVAQTLENR